MNIFQKFKLKSLLKKAKKLQQAREQGSGDMKNEIMILHNLGKFYDKHLYDKDCPHAREIALEYYRAAATLEDPEAQYICSQRFFDLAKFWENWAKEVYGGNIHKQYIDACYKEAFLYLEAAEASKHILAKRSHGMAYIHGWGVPKDTAKGFKLILESIEMENAWDRATKIIEGLGLNSPEFFEALMTYQSNRKSS